MCSGVGRWACPQRGFPIRKSSNHSSVASSSRLIAGSYVLHRLLVPRHPPCALKNLTTDTKMLASTMQFSSYGREPLPTPAPTPTHPHRARRGRFDRRSGPQKKQTQQRPFPQDPTACQTPHRATRAFHPHPKAGSTDTKHHDEKPNSRRSTLEQPPRNARPGSGPGPTHPQDQPGGRRASMLLRKEVIQPHLPVRLPCYDFVPIASPTFDDSLPQGVGPSASGVTDFRDVTGGVYKARERIHRSVADLRLLATPTSRGRVADPDPN